jgi:hypothetical protein
MFISVIISHVQEHFNLRVNMIFTLFDVSDETAQRKKIELVPFLSVLPSGGPEVKYQLRTEAVVSCTLFWSIGHIRIGCR